MHQYEHFRFLGYLEELENLRVFGVYVKTQEEIIGSTERAFQLDP